MEIKVFNSLSSNYVDLICCFSEKQASKRKDSEEKSTGSVKKLTLLDENPRLSTSGESSSVSSLSLCSKTIQFLLSRRTS